MGDASLSESPEEEEDNDSPEPDGGDSSPQNTLPAPLSPPPSDSWQGSPRKRTQTLPSFNCPVTGMAAKAEALNRWSCIQESEEEKGGTLSEDIFKILDLEKCSLFSSPQVTSRTQEGNDKSMARRGSNPTDSCVEGSAKQGKDSQPSQTLSYQPGVGALTGTGSRHQSNNQPGKQREVQQDSKQLIDRSVHLYFKQQSTTLYMKIYLTQVTYRRDPQTQGLTCSTDLQDHP